MHLLREFAKFLTESDILVFFLILKLDWLCDKLRCTRNVAVTSISPRFWSAFLEPGFAFKEYHLKCTKSWIT